MAPDRRVRERAQLLDHGCLQVVDEGRPDEVVLGEPGRAARERRPAADVEPVLPGVRGEALPVRVAQVRQHGDGEHRERGGRHRDPQPRPRCLVQHDERDRREQRDVGRLLAHAEPHHAEGEQPPERALRVGEADGGAEREQHDERQEELGVDPERVHVRVRRQDIAPTVSGTTGPLNRVRRSRIDRPISSASRTVLPAATPRTGPSTAMNGER